VWHFTFGLGLPADGASFGGEVGNSASHKTKGKRMDSLIDGLAEVRRERLIRQTVYPRLVTTGKLTQAEASRRMSALESAERWLQCLIRNYDRASQVLDL
jgi:hypothetical protein